MKSLFRLLIVLCFASTCHSLLAQLDKIQFIPPFYSVSNSASNVGKQYIVLSTYEENPFQVTILKGSVLYDTVDISRKNPHLLYLGDGLVNMVDGVNTGIVPTDSLNKVLKCQGFRLEADQPFFSAVYQKSNSQGDILTCKGSAALGNEFYSGHLYSAYSSSDDIKSHFISVYAEYDNTNVTISNSRVRWRDQPNTFQVTLNKGESYVVGVPFEDAASYGVVNINDYNGTKITSTKPVAVNSGSWCSSGHTGGSRDIGIDQIVPINFVGKEYIAVEGEGTEVGEKVIVVATQADTKLYVNGDLEHTLANQGDYYVVGRDAFSDLKNIYIKGDKNIYVYQTFSGGTSDVSVGLCFLPPLSCLSNREVTLSYADLIGAPKLNLIVELGSDVYINGERYIGQADAVPGNDDWVTYRVSNAEMAYFDPETDEFVITSTGAINVSMSLVENVIGAAGYYSGFGDSPSMQAIPTIMGTEACYPDNAIIVASGYDDYVWYFNNEIIVGETSASITPSLTGQYRVSGRTVCGVTKPSDPMNLKTCLSLIGGGVVDEGVGDVVVKVRLGLPSEKDVCYWYRTLPNTAIEGYDYLSSVGMGIIPAGETEDSVAFSIVNDLMYESADETMIFEIYFSDQATVKNGKLTYTIQDDDELPRITIPSTINVQEDADTLTLVLVKNGVTQDSVFLNYHTSDNLSAKYGEQFGNTSGILMFLPSETTKEIKIPIYDNDVNNQDYTFKIGFTNGVNVIISGSSSFVTIQDDENTTTCLSLTQSSLEINEGEELIFTVSLDHVEGIDVNFRLLGFNETAEDDDYIPIVDKLYTLKAGVKDTTFTVLTNGDKLPEEDEVFSYLLTDVVGARSCTDAVKVTILNDDYIPLLLNDNYNGVEDKSIQGNVLINDEITGDFPIALQFLSPPSGELSYEDNGDFTFIPEENYFGLITFEYMVVDASDDTVTAQVTINFEKRDDVPLAINDTVDVQEDSLLIFDPRINDFDYDKSGLSITDLGLAQHGSCTNSLVNISYLPEKDFYGLDSVIYGITDIDGGTEMSATIYFKVLPRYDAATAIDDNFVINEDEVNVSFNVLFNDLNPDHTKLTILEVWSVLNGEAVKSQDALLFTPTKNFWGNTTLLYSLQDVGGGIDTAKVSIVVNNIEDIPEAVNDFLFVDEDAQGHVDVLLNDVDGDANGLVISSISIPSEGSASFVSGVVSYKGNTDFCGVDSLSYVVEDDNGDQATGILHITVSCVDERPEAGNDNYSILEDAGIQEWDVLINDIDHDGDALSLVEVLSISHASVTIEHNKLLFEANENFNGTNVFSYVVADGDDDRDTAQVTVSITSQVDYPLPSDDYISVNEDASVTFLPLVNDVDPDGDILSIKGHGEALHGTIIPSYNEFTYLPDADYNGQDSFLYTVTKLGAFETTACVHITVNALPDVPQAVDDAYSLMEDDVSKAFDVLANDNDVDNDQLFVHKIISSSNGSASIGDNKLNFKPNANFFGTITVVYEVRSYSLVGDTGRVTFTVVPQNDMPIANADAVACIEDHSVLINVLDNDLSIDHNGLAIDSIGKALHGIVSIVGDVLKYMPNPDYYGIDQVNYYIKDGDGDIAGGMVQISVTQDDTDRPISKVDSFIIDEDAALELFDVLANDENPDAGELVIQSIYKGMGAVVNNQLQYAPSSNFFGVDVLSYIVSDWQGDTDTCSVFFTVKGVNDFPIATHDEARCVEDDSVLIDVLIDDMDVDHSTIRLDSLGDANYGRLRQVGQEVRYIPNVNFAGNDVFTYYIIDGEGDTASAIVNVTVSNVNDFPEAYVDTFYINEDMPLQLYNVLLNDSCPDEGGLDILMIVDGNATHIDNRVKYVPDLNYFGVDSIDYVVVDKQGDKDTARAYFVVSSISDMPLATDDYTSCVEDYSVLVSVLQNDVDVDLNGLTIGGVGIAMHGFVSQDGDAVLYEPWGDFFGRDSFVYHIIDGDGDKSYATVHLVVQEQNDAPLAYEDTFSIEEDAYTALYDVLLNDSSPDGGLLFLLDIIYGDGEVSNNFLQYTPVKDYFGRDTVSYVLMDKEGDTDTTNVYFNIHGTNDLPIATSDNSFCQEDDSVLIDVLVDDVDIDLSGVTIDSLGDASYGKVYVYNEQVKYVPNTNYYGIDSFHYYIVDGEGDKAWSHVNITISPVNDSPIAIVDTFIIPEDSDLGFYDVMINDLSPDGGDLTLFTLDAKYNVISDILAYSPEKDFFGLDSVVYVVADEQGDRDTAKAYFEIEPVSDFPLAMDDYVFCREDSLLSILVLNNDVDIDKVGLSISDYGSPNPQNGSLQLRGDTLVYAAFLNFTGHDYFQYILSDADGDLDTAEVFITVSNVNDVPTAIDTVLYVSEDMGLVRFDVIANDLCPDTGGLLLVKVIDDLVDIKNNKLEYITEDNFFGADTFQYVIIDKQGDVDTARAIVNVTPVSDFPIGNADGAVCLEDQQVFIDVLLNDVDIDINGLSLVNITQALHGDVTQYAGGVLYEPDYNYSGIDTFYYTMKDGDDDEVTAQVEVSILEENDIPVAMVDTFKINEDETEALYAVLHNDSCPDVGELSLTKIVSGHASILANELVYKPEINYFGLDSVLCEIEDAQGDKDTAFAFFMIKSVSDLPKANPDALSCIEDSFATVSILLNDVDVDNMGMVIDSLGKAANGQLTFFNNDVEYRPNPNYFGVDTFSYYVKDADGDIAKALVTITVVGVNDLPIAESDSFTILEDAILKSYDVLANDSNFDIGALLIEKVICGAGVIIDNKIEYAPRADFYGRDSLYISVIDEEGDLDSSYAIFIVQSISDAPIAHNDEAYCLEDLNTAVFVLNNDEDIDCNGLRIDSIGIPQFGELTRSLDMMVYTPNPNFYGVDSFYYYISDADGERDNALVTINVEAVNDWVIAIDDTFYIQEDADRSFYDVLHNDLDPDAMGLVVRNILSGDATIVNDSIYYEPEVNFFGDDTIIYVMEDAEGDADTASAVFYITALSEAPIANDDVTGCVEDAFVEVDVLMNDVDIDKSGLFIHDVRQAYHGDISITSTGLKYVPLPDFFGVDSFLYVLKDAEGEMDSAVVYVVVTAINDIPFALPDTFYVNEDDTLLLDVKANDIDAEGLDSCIVNFVQYPSLGRVTSTDDIFKYIPHANVWGKDTLSYFLTDVEGMVSSQVLVCITIDSINEAPLLEVIHASVFNVEIDTLNVMLEAQSPDGSELSLIALGEPSHGTASLFFNRVLYVPEENYIGLDTFVYYVKDGESDMTMSYVYYTVNHKNKAPVAINDIVTVIEDETTSIYILHNDIDREDTLMVDCQIITTPSLGTYTFNNGVLIYKPSANVWGLDTMSYMVIDSANAFSNEAFVYITIDSVNESPIVDTMYVDATEDQESTFHVMNYASSPDFSELELVSAQATYGALVTIKGDVLVYLPQQDREGTDSISYRVADAEGDTTEGVVYVTLLGVNDAPVAMSDTFTVQSRVHSLNSFDLDVLANDYDMEKDSLSIELDIVPKHGSFYIKGNVVQYDPDMNFEGIDSFSYHLIDEGLLQSDPQLVIVNVERLIVEERQVDTLQVLEDDYVSFSLLPKPTSTIRDSFIYMYQDEFIDNATDSLFTPFGMVLLSEKLDASYYPLNDFFGVDSFVYHIVDTFDQQVTVVLYLSVLASNDAPINITRPTIVGEHVQTSVLHCLPGVWFDADADSLNYTYTWKASRQGEVYNIYNITDSIHITDDLANANLWCEVSVSDMAKVGESFTILLYSDTSYANFFCPEDIVLSSDFLCRSWLKNTKIADLSCLGEGYGGDVSYELLSEDSRFVIGGDQLRLDTLALRFKDERILLDIRVHYAEDGYLFSDYNVGIDVIYDLLPSMNDTYPHMKSIDHKDAIFAYMADKPGFMYYALVDSAEPIPSFEEVSIGDTFRIDHDSEQLIEFEQLRLEHPYQLVFYLQDPVFEQYSGPYTIDFVAEDLQAPNFLSKTPYIKYCDIDSALLFVSLDEVGTLSLGVFENDITVLTNGDEKLDTSIIHNVEIDIQTVDSIYEIVLNPLSSQMTYDVELFATDLYHNESLIQYFDFSTPDTINPFFIHVETRIKQIIDNVMTYEVQASEQVTLHADISELTTYTNEVMVSDTAIISLASADVIQNVLVSTITDKLEINGRYSLNLHLVDTAGNRSVTKHVAFTYPVYLGMILQTPVVYIGEQLVFTGLNFDSDYKIFNSAAREVQRGVLLKDDSVIDVGRLLEGTYVMYVKNRFEEEAFKFFKVERIR